VPEHTQPTEDQERPAGGLMLAACLCVLFFISGSVGLVYEVAWKHIFTIVFGNTTYAVSVVISVFMAGLALGSFAFGKVADRARRHLRLFAFLQAGIAVSAVLVPPLLERAEGLYGAVFRSSYSPGRLILVQVPVSAAILLVPTFLMGGTLPVLSRFLAARRRQVGPAVGLLYGVNTLGAAAGAFLAGFVLIEAFGVLRTVHLAAGFNLAVAALFLVLDFLWGGAEAHAERAEAPQSAPAALIRPQLALLIAAVTISGFVSFSYEVLWTRLLEFRFKTTVYAFSVMLTAFLLGLGLGGAVVGLVRRNVRSKACWRIYGYLEAAVGVCGLASVFLFFLPRIEYHTFAGRALAHLAASMAVMIVPTALMGAAFPIACHLLAAGVHRTGRSVGNIYVFNTIGAVSGALLTGFVLVGAFGTQSSLALVSFLMVASGSAILIMRAPGAGATGGKGILRRLRPVAPIWVVALLVWVLTPSDLLQRFFLANQSVALGNPGKEVSLLGYGEGPEGVVVVSELKGQYKVIAAGATDVAGTNYILRNTQKLQAHVPMLIHPDPRAVCQIGFGSGETARIFASYDVERFDCAEISPVMLEMAREHFGDINGDVLDNPKCNIVLMDAAAYLRYTDQTYDVIANDATWPSQAGPAMLFTLEHFRNGRRCLKPGGIMTSWLPLDMPLRDVKTILRTFHDVFPHVYVWSALNQENKHALIVGGNEPLRVDAARFLERFNRYAREDLKSVYLDDPAVFLACHLARVEGMEADLADAPLQLNYRPVLQFMYSRLYDLTEMVVDCYALLAGHRDSILNHLTNIDGLENGGEFAEKVRRIEAANERLLRAFTLSPERKAQKTVEINSALELAPEHPAAALVAAAQERLRLSADVDLPSLPLPDLQERARALLRYGPYDKALAALEEWVAREPASAEAHSALGMCLLLTGRFQAAIERLSQATALDTSSADTHFNLGVAYMQTNQPARAVEALRQAVRLAPGMARAHAQLGTAYGMLGQMGPAVQHLRRAVFLDPQLPDARRNLGTLYVQLGDLGNGVRHLERSLALGLEAPGTHRLLAEAYRRMGDPTAAELHLKRAAELQAAGETPPRGR